MVVTTIRFLLPRSMRTSSAVYWQKGVAILDEHNLLGTIEDAGLKGFQFELSMNNFQMIDSVQMPVIIPGDADCKSLADRS